MQTDDTSAAAAAVAGAAGILASHGDPDSATKLQGLNPNIESQTLPPHLQVLYLAAQPLHCEPVPCCCCLALCPLPVQLGLQALQRRLLLLAGQLQQRLALLLQHAPLTGEAASLLTAPRLKGGLGSGLHTRKKGRAAGLAIQWGVSWTGSVRCVVVTRTGFTYYPHQHKTISTRKASLICAFNTLAALIISTSLIEQGRSDCPCPFPLYHAPYRQPPPLTCCFSHAVRSCSSRVAARSRSIRIFRSFSFSFCRSGCTASSCCHLAT